MNPVHTEYEKVRALELFEGLTLKVLLTGSETNGVQAILKDIAESGAGPGRHIHHQRDETFPLLEGAFDVEVDGKPFRMKAGGITEDSMQLIAKKVSGAGKCRSTTLKTAIFARSISQHKFPASIDQGKRYE